MNRAGLTLIEMLVSMTILAVLMTAVVSMMVGTLRFSSATVSAAERLEELNGASAYLSDMLRRSSTVFLAISVNGLSCQTSSGNCVAVIVPESQTGDAIDSYVFLAYRLEPRSQLGADYKVANAWADANTRVLLEYRKELCGPATVACSGVPSVSSVTNAQAYFVADSLVQAADLAQPAISYANNRFLLRFQIKDPQGGAVRLTPSDGPVALSVERRN